MKPMKSMRHAALGLLLAMSLPALAEQGQPGEAIYKCKDAKGKVVYSEKACAGEGGAMKSLPALNEQKAAAKPAGQPATAAAEATAKAGVPSASGNHEFRCDERKECGALRSCEEAEFFLKNCSAKALDTDADGIPCEGSWCGVEGKSDVAEEPAAKPATADEVPR